MTNPEPKPVEEYCQSCEDAWDSQGKPRKKRVLIGSTINRKFAVLVCPYCDGERAITIAKAKRKK